MSRAIVGDMIMTGVSSRVDGSLSLRFNTTELTVEEKVALMGLQNQEVRVLLQTKTSEAPAELKEIKGQFDRKTDSQRLRGLLFVQWKQAKTDQDFEAYYHSAMYAFCETIRSKLEPDV